MKLVAYADYMENHGTIDNPCWVNLGPKSYIIENDLQTTDQKEIYDIVNKSLHKFEYKTKYACEVMYKWEILNNDQIDEVEQRQLDNQDEITSTARDLTYDNIKKWYN